MVCDGLTVQRPVVQDESHRPLDRIQHRGKARVRRVPVGNISRCRPARTERARGIRAGRAPGGNSRRQAHNVHNPLLFSGETGVLLDVKRIFRSESQG